jgi:hypothetical protein
VAWIHSSGSHVLIFIQSTEIQLQLRKTAQICLTTWTVLLLNWVNKNIYLLNMQVSVFGSDCYFGRIHALMFHGRKKILSIKRLFIEEIKAFLGWPKSLCSFIMSLQYCCRDLLHVKWGLEHKRMTCQMGVSCFLLYINKLCNLPEEWFIQAAKAGLSSIPS